MNSVNPEEPAMIAVMGATGSGKSTFINLASGSNLATGSGLQSCTSTVQCTSPFNFEKRSVVLVDTPGFDDTNKSDSEILSLIAAFLAESYSSDRKLAGIIYIHRISDNRVGGASRKNFKMFRKLCGSDNMENVVLVTNMWGTVPQDQAEKRETELSSSNKFFKPVLDEGAQMIRHMNTKESVGTILQHLVHNTPIVAQIQHEMIVEGKSLEKTAAGTEINREALEMAAKHKIELENLRKGMEQAMVERDEKTRREHQIEIDELKSTMKRMGDDNKDMQSKYEEERERIRTLKSQVELNNLKHTNETTRLSEKLQNVKKQREVDDRWTEIFRRQQLENAVSQGKQLGVQETEARYNTILEGQEDRERMWDRISDLQGQLAKKKEDDCIIT